MGRVHFSHRLTERRDYLTVRVLPVDEGKQPVDVISMGADPTTSKLNSLCVFRQIRASFSALPFLSELSVHMIIRLTLCCLTFCNQFL